MKNLTKSGSSSVAPNAKWLFWLPVIILVMAQVLVSTENALTALGLSRFTPQFFGAAETALPEVTTKSLNVIIASIYPVITGTFMISGAVIGLKYGWKKGFIFGSGLIVIGEISTFILLIISSNSPAQSIGQGWAFYICFILFGRLLVALGGSMLIPSVIAITSAVYQGRARFVAFTLIGSGAGLAVIVGYYAFGTWTFFTQNQLQYMYLLVAVFFFLTAISSIKGFPKLPAHEAAQKAKADKLGVIFLSLGLIFFLLGLQMIGILSGLGNSSDIGFIAIPLILALIFLVAGVIYERRRDREGKTVVVPMEYFRVRATRSGLILNVIIYCGLAVLIFINAVFLLGQGLIDFSGNNTHIESLGVVLVAVLFMSGSLFVFSIVGPKIFKKLSWRHSCTIGIALTILGCFILAFFIPIGEQQADGMYRITAFSQVHPMFFIGNMIAGTGVGILSGYSGGIVSLTVNQEDAEVSGGAQAAARNIGNALANTFLVTLFIIIVGATVNGPATIPQVRDANKWAIVALSILLLSGFLIVPWIPKNQEDALRIKEERSKHLQKAKLALK